MPDEKRLIYVAGHNIVIYNADEGTQQFVSGSENATQINYVTLSPSGRYLAYCERAEPRAQVTVYEIPAKKKRKTLPEPGMETLNAIECKAFLSCAFSSATEDAHLVTLARDNDWYAIVWQWDTNKMLLNIPLNVVDPHIDPLTFQISLQKVGQDFACVVTGSYTYKYIKITADLKSNDEMHSQLLPHGRDEVSQEYTSHAWAKDTVQLIVTTANGDILVCAMSGEFLILIPDSPRGCRIDSICPHSQGVIFGGADGMIWLYNSSENEHVVYALAQRPVSSANRDCPPAIQIEPASITQMAISPEEDILYYIDRNN